MPERPPPPTRAQLVLRRGDQLAVALLLAFGLVAMAGYWARHAWQGDRLIEIDRAPKTRTAYVVDINEAGWPELSQIPGLGETLARRIVDRRAEQGPYRDLDELRDIQGIGPRTLERMRPFLLPIPDRETVAGP